MFVFDLFLQNDAYCLQIILQRKNLTSSIDQIDPNFSITLPLVSVFFRSCRNFVSRGLRPQVYVIWQWSSYIIDKLGFRLSPFPALCTSLCMQHPQDCSHPGTGADTAGGSQARAAGDFSYKLLDTLKLKQDTHVLHIYI